MYPEPGSPNGFCGKFVKLNAILQRIINQQDTKTKFEFIFFTISLIFVPYGIEDSVVSGLLPVFICKADSSPHTL